MQILALAHSDCLEVVLVLELWNLRVHRRLVLLQEVSGARTVFLDLDDGDGGGGGSLPLVCLPRHASFIHVHTHTRLAEVTLAEEGLLGFSSAQ